MAVKEKVKEFWKEHKGTIVKVGLGVGGTVAGVLLFKKACGNKPAKLPSAPTFEDLDPSDLAIGTVEELWSESYRDNSVINGIVNDLKPEDLGKLGESITKLDSVAPDTDVSLMFAVKQKME